MHHFAKNTFSENLITDILKYRIYAYKNDDDDELKSTEKELEEFDNLILEYQIKDSVTLDMVAKSFNEILPNDQLNNFLKLL